MKLTVVTILKPDKSSTFTGDNSIGDWLDEPMLPPYPFIQLTTKWSLKSNPLSMATVGYDKAECGIVGFSHDDKMI